MYIPEPDRISGPAVSIDRINNERDRLVTRYGWLLIRGLSDVFARQSLVGDAPFLDTRHFSFPEELTGNWETIRDEAVEILRHREAIPVFHEVSPEQRHISTGDSWRTFLLFGFGARLDKNCSEALMTECPKASCAPTWAW